MRPKVVVKDGRLTVKKPPPTTWKPVELRRCTCGAIASWQHPTLGFRCNTCPRPERFPDPPKAAEVIDAVNAQPSQPEHVPATGTLTALDAALLKLRSAMRARGEIGPASELEAELEQLASQAKPALDVYGQLKRDGLADGWPQKLTPAGREAASKIAGPR
jgi:hypothetical protein